MLHTPSSYSIGVENVGGGQRGFSPHIVQMIKSNYFKLHCTRDIIAYNVILIKAKDIIA